MRSVRGFMQKNWGWLTLGGVAIVSGGAWWIMSQKASAATTAVEKTIADGKKLIAQLEAAKAAKDKKAVDELKAQVAAGKAQAIADGKELVAQLEAAKLKQDAKAVADLKEQVAAVDQVAKDVQAAADAAAEAAGGLFTQGYGFSYYDPSSWGRVNPKLPAIYIGGSMFKRGVGMYGNYNYFAENGANFGRQSLYV